jgi:putative ABC transport system substrate-binding protein
MNKTLSLWLLAIVFLASAAVAQAQEGKKIPWIGYLAGSGSSPNQAFVQGMRDLGYVEGKNIGIVYRTAEGRRERYPDIAAELVRLKVDVIVTDVSAAGRVLKKATNTIPIVMTSGTDLVADGLVASHARPGGNVTGLTNVGAELGGKLLEILKEVTPKLNRVAVLGSSEVFFKETEAPARALGIQLLGPMVKGPDDIDGAFRTISKERVNGLLMRLQPSVFAAHRRRVAELTASSRLPSIATGNRWVDEGGLMSYGSDLNFQYRRAATYVDKILKGTKPADLPVEAPMKFEFAINLKTAKQIGVSIPPNVLARATRIIR